MTMTTDVLSGLDASFLQDNDALVTAYKDIDWHNMDSLNLLVSSIERVVIKYKTPNSQIKEALKALFWQILDKFPLLFGYWRKFTAVVYQLDGLEASISILQKATELVPRSLELWGDYLNVLCANRADQVELIRESFIKAKTLVGYHFLSDSFWDKYIAFETKNENWDNLIEIYQELINIPLYQYAKYNQSYKKLLDSGKVSVKDATLVDKLKSTQKLVGLCWAYESKIKQSYFTLGSPSDVELQNWSEYVNYLTTNQEKIRIDNYYIQMTFERCLIPCAYFEKFWLMYTNWLFLQKYPLDKTIKIYQNGGKILPSNYRSFRYDFLFFLKRNYSNDKDIIFAEFQNTVASLIELWPKEVTPMAEYLVMLKRYKYSSQISQTEKEVISIQINYWKYLDICVNNYIKGNIDKSDPLQALINNNNLPAVIGNLIKHVWIVLRNKMQTMKYFNFFGKNKILKSSLTFWLLYYKFHKSSKNFIKLEKFINDLGSKILLPTTIIDDILTDYSRFYLTNSSVSIYQNSVRNQSIDEPLTVDPILYSQLKLHDPTWYPGKNFKVDPDVIYKSPLFKQNGHPGIIVEEPIITNSIISKVSQEFSDSPPNLPQFRNLERLNQLPKYFDPSS